MSKKVMFDITEAVGKVVARMRGIDISYGQPALDYLDSLNVTDENRALMPFYEYGHRLEISRLLLEHNNDMVRKYQKYPLIALRMPIVEQQSGGMVHYRLNIAFLAFTKKEYHTKDRMEKVIKPILFPMVDRFFDELGKVGLFTFVERPPEHKRAIIPFWGTQYSEGSNKHIFNDPIDAIEFLDIKVSTVQQKC